MNTIPKKISPDRIKDSILLLNYTSNIPYPILLGKIYDVLTKQGDFILPLTPLNTKSTQPEFTQQLNNSNELTLVSEDWLLVNNVIKIQLRPYVLVFNCVNEYPSWDVYLPEVLKVLELLEGIGHIIRYNSFQLRYINHFQNIDLIDKVKVDLENKYSYEQQNTVFRRTLVNGTNSIIINIANKLLSNEKPHFVSVIDIAVSDESIKIQSISELQSVFNEAHRIEKEIFFDTLTPSFIDSLNPVY